MWFRKDIHPTYYAASYLVEILELGRHIYAIALHRRWPYRDRPAAFERNNRGSPPIPPCRLHFHRLRGNTPDRLRRDRTSRTVTSSLPLSRSSKMADNETSETSSASVIAFSSGPIRSQRKEDCPPRHRDRLCYRLAGLPQCYDNI